MSTTTNEIIEKLKSITLLEASELVSQIEETFGVDASASVGGGFMPAGGEGAGGQEAAEEKTSFDVILEDVPSDKRVAVLKIIRNLTSLGLKEAKEFTTSLPKALKESVSKEEADTAKQQLEQAGRCTREQGGFIKSPCPVFLTVSAKALSELFFMSKVYDWFEERLEIQSIADDITSKYVPPHVNIFYCLGGITFTCFLVQVATGFAMTFYYRPTVAEAFASVQYLMTDVNFGWLIRSIHRWSASMMVLIMILHVFRVYLTGGFKKPRELTWVTGVIMAVCTVSFGVTGYSLPWDQVGYWAVKIVTGVPDAIPVVGSTLVELLRGGVGVGQSTLTRFYSLHTFVLPLLTAVFMLMHFLMIRKQGISGPL
ncbi:hypothetical protein CMV_027823 [Castanea mollissima]|uniref:Cytochrome b6 n=1 Tax=Castanea mollissima TaxID=60419 RepID=A0A8J4Q8T8_9ROSI|nr:hypothetical protein CMV_027823 [Castanea mollissima]